LTYWEGFLALDIGQLILLSKEDLVRDQSQKNSLTLLQDPPMLPQHKTWAVFVLSSWHMVPDWTDKGLNISPR